MTARGGKCLCAAGAVAAAFLAGCSSAGTSTATSTASSTATATASASATGTAAVCASVAKLKDDVVGLKDINITANGTSAVSAQLTKIQQQLDVVKTDARGQFSPQITNLQSALSRLGSSLTAVRDNPNGSTLAALASAAGTVVATGNSLISAVTSTC
jgi:uncharacterized phage infection (PIP) family protein YhgE